jgi:hypothetical protein
VIRQLKVFAISMVFTTVAMGFAYALPTALRDTASQVPAAFELPEQEAGLLATSVQAHGRGRSQGKPGDPVDKETKTEDREGSKNHSSANHSSAKDENHGSVVRVAAHCSVTGRAHGELVRSVARDKDMTVADAERACKAATAKQEQVESDESNKPETPGHSAQAPGQVKSNEPATPGNSAQAPGQAKPEKPATPASPGKPDNPGKSH